MHLLGKTTHAHRNTRKSNTHVRTKTCTQTKHTLSITHTRAHTQTCTQWSQCWLLPVGLWSLNCLSDSSLSKFTMRDPALCLPKLLQLKHTYMRAPKKKHMHTHRRTENHVDV